jgi:hypothetical protein
VGIVVFIPAWLTAVGIPAFSFINRLAYPLSWAGIVVAVWYVLGVIYLLYLQARAPERVRDTARVFEEADASLAP